MAFPLHIRKMSVFLNDVIQVLSQINLYLSYHYLYLSTVLKSLSRVQLFVTPMGCSLLDSSVHGILQARILKQVAISFSRRTSRPRDRTCVS